MALRFPPNGTQSLWTSCHDFEKGTQSTCFQHLFCIFYIQSSPMLQKNDLLTESSMISMDRAKRMALVLHLCPIAELFPILCHRSTSWKYPWTAGVHQPKTRIQTVFSAPHWALWINIRQYPISHRHRFRLQVSNFVGSVVICCNIDLSSS